MPSHTIKSVALDLHDLSFDKYATALKQISSCDEYFVDRVTVYCNSSDPVLCVKLSQDNLIIICIN